MVLILRGLGRLVGVLALAGAVSALTFLAVFLQGVSPEALAWRPALGAIAILSIGLLADWSRKGARRRIIDGVLTAMLVSAVIGAAGWLGGWFARPPIETPMAALASDGYVATRDGVIFFHQSAATGSDRPVLLVLHGGPGSGSVLLRAALGEQLESSFRTVFFDQRGVGRSSAVTSFSIDDYLDDIERLRRTLKIDSWYLFGVSWGAALANEYAVRNPERVRGVVTWGGLVANQPVTRSLLKALSTFYAATGNRVGMTWSRALETQVSPYTRLQTVRVMNAVNRARLKTVLPREREIEIVLAARDLAVRRWGYGSRDTGGSLWATAATFMQARLEAYDFAPRLRELTMPYLFMMGEQDPLLKAVDVDGYVRSMPRAAVRRIPGSGHTLDRPEATAAAIIDFVNADAQGQ